MLQFFVVFLKCTLEKGLGCIQHRGSNSRNLVICLFKTYFKFYKQEFSKPKTKFSVQFQIQINMPSIIHLSNIWEHTLNEILSHDIRTEVGIIMRSWVKHNKLEDMTSLLIYGLNDLTPTGTLCFYKEKLESEEAIMMPTTPLKELCNLYRYIYRYIQHLILESEYDYDDDEFDDPLDEENWLLQTRGKYMRLVIYHSSTAIEPRNTSNQNVSVSEKA